MNEKKIILLDPSSGSANLGDEIIRDSVENTIRECSRSHPRIIRISVHQKISRAQMRVVENADLIIAGGSNLLNFKYAPFYEGRWKNSLTHLLKLKNILLLGVGWSAYKDNSTKLGRILYRRTLSKTLIHSVRDEFTRKRLLRFGVKNTSNTTCPTMWNLTQDHLAKVPRKKQDSAIVTLTDYAPITENDHILLETIRKSYKKMYFWPQGARDLEYFKSIAPKDVIIVGPSLSAFDEVLESKESIDYVGTRLHGGIRALQKGRRALVVSIDNRAREIARDTNLPIISREEIEKLEATVQGDIVFDLKLPREEIHAWKVQLTGLLS